MVTALATVGPLESRTAAVGPPLLLEASIVFCGRRHARVQGEGPHRGLHSRWGHQGVALETGQHSPESQAENRGRACHVEGAGDTGRVKELTHENMGLRSGGMFLDSKENRRFLLVAALQARSAQLGGFPGT